MFPTSILVLGAIIGLSSFAESTCIASRIGIEDGSISTSRLSASSEKIDRLAPDFGRLNFLFDAIGSNGVPGKGAWSPYSDIADEWIQVDIGSLTTVTGVITQGRNSNYYAYWVKSYKVIYSVDGVFMTIKDADDNDAVFDGNSDKDTEVTNMLENPVLARYIRISPVTWKGSIAMRFELLGCLDGTILYNHHCYKVVNADVTWSDAKAACKDMSAALITINTAQELAYVADIALTFSPFPYPWTGLNDIAEEGNLVWLTYAQPTYNVLEENSDPGDMDCVRIGQNGAMRYASCSYEFGYICEASSFVHEKYSLNAEKKSPVTEYVVRSLKAVSFGACSLECGKVGQCVSFSFSRSSQECILSTSTGQSSELEDAKLDFFVVTSTEEICKPL